MTRKDYKLIASVIRPIVEEAGCSQFIRDRSRADGMRELVDAFVKVLQEDNSRFDPVKFKAACGYPIK